MSFLCTLAKVGERLQDAPSESCHGVLHAGAQTQHALEVGLLQQQLPVRHELVRPAQQGGDAVHKLRHQARVRVVCLAVVVGHNLEDGGTRGAVKTHCETLAFTHSHELKTPEPDTSHQTGASRC